MKDRTYNPCGKPQQHREHLCMLMEEGKTEEVRKRSSQPAYVCRNCRAQANEAEDLCNPQSI